MQLLLALKVLRYVIYEDKCYVFQENNFPCFTQNGNTTELMSTTFSSNERVVIPANTLSIGTRYIITCNQVFVRHYIQLCLIFFI